ncbi:MAG TPA: type II toxin-antitoxin system VapC family toxin [Acidocella sp.]|nr:type II toxin-antitoxin system VapC family toxin [Acidocella sp.]HQU04228.1 type II toxin-antitoxin system VapC family toxin [Acidocella sp.]
MLDTQVLVWWVNGDTQRLSIPAREAIEAELPNGEINLSAMTGWEIAMLVRSGRMALGQDVAAWLALVGQIPAVKFIAVDNEIAVKSVELPGAFHKDPADRLIVATARKLGLALVTADEKIQNYPHIRTIW